MAKKTTKKPRVNKKQQHKKGIEKHEIMLWFLSTLFLGVITMCVYWGMTGSFIAGMQEFLAVIIISTWTIVSAMYLFPKFKKD